MTGHRGPDPPLGLGVASPRARELAGRPLTNVTLKQLQAFVAVADLGRFNLAASSLNLTQSAVSILIKELESELQHRLFDRSTRMVSPTRAAREFLPASAQDTRRSRNRRRRHPGFELATAGKRRRRRRDRTGGDGAVARCRALRPALSDIAVQIRDMPEEEILPSLKRNEVDLGLGTHSGDDAEIEATPLGRDRLTLVCRADHPFASLEAVRWSKLSGELLIGLAKDNPLRGMVDRLLTVVGAEVKTRYEVRYSTTAISMIAEGLGVAILPENSCQLTTAVNIKTILLADPVISRDISLLQLKQRMLSPAASRMKETLVESIGRLQANYADAVLA